MQGGKEGVVQKKITFDDYKKMSVQRGEQWRVMNTFKSRVHEIYTETTKE
jgi:hypothetical protein